MERSEEEIFLRAKHGDISAFEKIVSTHERALFNYILRLTGNTHDSEDLLQETFLKIYNSIKTYDTARPFKTWAYTIATRTAYDFFRKKKVRKELLTLDEEGPDETFEDPEAYNKIERLGDLEAALKKIKPVYQSVLLLYYQEGFSYEEISSMLGAPLNTIKTNLRRAKLELKKILS